MADIRKRTGRKGTTYQVRYPSRTAKTGYEYATFDTLKEARAFTENLGSFESVPGGQAISVVEAVDRWLSICEKIGRDGREKVEKQTYNEYARRAKVMKEYCWTKPLHELEQPDVVAFRKWLLETRTRDLARRCLSSFHSVIIEMKSEGLIKGDPAAGITIKSGGRYEEEDGVDREKLMMVTRQFAREHGLELPEGYGPGRFDERRQKVSLYERAQERATGITKEERQLQVTQAWRQSDSPKAFVRALEDLGYVLATGNRPYVLVDIYGGMNALPKLIDDRSVRTKDIRAFLEKEFPPESLPTVDEAKALVAQHRKAREQFAKAKDAGEQVEKLARAQAARRAPVEAARAEMVARQERERAALLREQQASRQALRTGYLAEVVRVRQQRDEARPTGLAAFLGRVTGVSAIIHRVQRYKDAKRYIAFRERKQEIIRAQRVETALLQRRHELQALDMNRQLKALTAVDARERKALEEKRVREQRLKDRAGHEHMPALALDLKPRGRSASVRRAKDRYRDRTGRDHARDEERAMRARIAEEEKRQEPDTPDIDLKDAHREALERQEPWSKDVDLPGDFARAAGSEEGGGDGGGDGTEEPIRISRAERKGERQRSRQRGRDDFERER